MAKQLLVLRGPTARLVAAVVTRSCASGAVVGNRKGTPNRRKFNRVSRARPVEALVHTRGGYCATSTANAFSGFKNRSVARAGVPLLEAASRQRV